MLGKLLLSTDLPYGVVIIIKGKFSKSTNKFVVDEIFTPQLPDQQ
jgi:hypothetical protein